MFPLYPPFWVRRFELREVPNLREESELLRKMQFGAVLLVAGCALLPGHNRGRAPSTRWAPPAVMMVATFGSELRDPAVRNRRLPAQHEGGLRGRRIQGPEGVPVSLPVGAASMPPGSQRTVAGEHLVQSPNILQGFTPDGPVREYPRLTQEEELELVGQARFYVAAADAKRELRAAATEHAEELYVLNHEELLRHIRRSVDATEVKRGRLG